MILKQLRMSRLLSQEQLARMSGLSVRTIQRIESGHVPSMESLKCLASVLEVDVPTLTQERFTMNGPEHTPPSLPVGMKWLFAIGFLRMRPARDAAVRVEIISHVFGFCFCILGVVNEPSLVGGIILLANAYLFRLHIRLGDEYGAWYDPDDPSSLHPAA